MIDAGADAVIGHGPHVLRGIEFYRGRPIVYSLGNFLTYRGFNLEGPLGVTGVLQLELGPDGGVPPGAARADDRSGRCEGPSPDPLAGRARSRDAASRSRISVTMAARIAPDGTIAAPP